MAKNHLEHTSQLSRHSHDTSAAYGLTLSPGIIIPVYFDVLNPSDTVYLKSHVFARLKDTLTAFRGEIDLHVDSFFVPLQMLYTAFGQVFAQTDDFVSSFYGDVFSHEAFPLIDMSQIDLIVRNAVGTFSDFECNGKALLRLLSAFDLNPYQVQRMATTLSGDTSPKDDTNQNPPISPWLPCAYQAIYQNYYRNDDFERRDVSSYNFDYYASQTKYWLNSHFKLRHHQRPADYFTTVRVSPITSAVNSMKSDISDPHSLTDVILNVDNFLQPVVDSTGFQVYDSDTGSTHEADYLSTGVTIGQDTNADGYSFLNTSNIRSLFAIEKFARIYGRADKTYDAQILAHMGVKIPHDVKHDLTHIAHYRFVMTSDPIYGTSNNLDSNNNVVSAIGQVGGQCLVEGDTKQDKFTAPVHGVFMVCAYALTKPRYCTTFNKLNLLGSRLSFPIPEYDKLGAQPLYHFEFNTLALTDTGPHPFIAGWQNRYQEFKKKYNRVSPVFEGTNSFGSSTNIYAPWFISRTFALDGDQTFSDPDDNVVVSAIALFERPKALDSVMIQRFSASWDKSYTTHLHEVLQTDPIVLDYTAFAKKVSWMSETGEPDM